MVSWESAVDCSFLLLFWDELRFFVAIRFSKFPNGYYIANSLPGGKPAQNFRVIAFENVVS
jgi:hypothetical protein